MSLAGRVSAELSTHYARAVALQTSDASLWASLADLADLHRPAPEEQAGQPRCWECNRGEYGRVWPCQTLRLLATSIGIVTGAATRASGRDWQWTARVSGQADGALERRTPSANESG